MRTERGFEGGRKPQRGEVKGRSHSAHCHSGCTVQTMGSWSRQDKALVHALVNICLLVSVLVIDVLVENLREL